MRVLVHLGLNKCASTYLQRALDAARPELAEHGTWYPMQLGPPCQYGLSHALGFGPDNRQIVPQTLASLVETADQMGCSKLILSSEYLSLYRPKSAERLVDELFDLGCSARFALFSRPLGAWVRALFTQYVCMVDQGRYLPNIDAFVARLMGNGTLDIAERFDMWAAIAGSDCVDHYHLDGNRKSDVLRPFAAFARMPIPVPTDKPGTPPPGRDALYRIGLLRQDPPSPEREAKIAALLNGGPAAGPAPIGYDTISLPVSAKLQEDIGLRFAALPVRELPSAEKSASRIKKPNMPGKRRLETADLRLAG